MNVSASNLNEAQHHKIETFRSSPNTVTLLIPLFDLKFLDMYVEHK